MIYLHASQLSLGVGFDIQILHWPFMSPPDIIDPDLVIGIENGKKLVIVGELSSNIVNWYLQIELIMLHVLAFPCYN